MKNLLILFLFLVMPNLTVFCQSEATTKGAALVGGLFSFASQGGDLYGGFSNERLSNLVISPSALFFVADRFALGAALSLNTISQGGSSSTNLGIGPKIAYLFDSGSPTIPYLGGGVSYLSFGSDGDNEGGIGFDLGGGVIIRKGHLGFSFEGGYRLQSFKPEGFSENISGNIIYLAVGIIGFLH